MLRIAVVEDEERNRETLREYIEQYGKELSEQIEVQSYSDGDEIVCGYKPYYDVIFLDIEMVRMDGMTAAKKIREIDDQVILIFITNLGQYAMEGYQVEAMDYMVKPVSYFELSQRLTKAGNRIRAREVRDFLLVPVEGGIKKIMVDDILYFESFGHSIEIHTKQSKYRFFSSLKQLESKLKKNHFFRCNHGYLINLEWVESFHNMEVTVGEAVLPISRTKKKAFLEEFTNYIGQTR